jgi:hypothetical protein
MMRIFERDVAGVVGEPEGFNPETGEPTEWRVTVEPAAFAGALRELVADGLS